VDDAKCILVSGHEHLCVSVCSRPHAHTTALTRMQLGGMVGDAPSCALLGGARVALLWQHSANAKCQRVLVLALCLVPRANFWDLWAYFADRLPNQQCRAAKGWMQMISF